MEPTTYRKVMARVVAPLTFLIILSSLDRVNVSFAALEMNADLGLDPKAYGFGVGIFFVGYLLFQLPSSEILKRIGPRWWIAGSVIGWGIVATAMAAIQTPMHFYVLRFLLGVFESGFAPGVVWYVSQWLPQQYRARAIAGTMLAIPISVIFGGPLCGALMAMDTGSIASWRVMFFVEGLATVIAGIAAIFWFVNRPSEARWLSDQERQGIEDTLAAEVANARAPGAALKDALKDPILWVSAGVWFVLITGANAIIFWLPIAIKSLGRSDPLEIGILAALPWVAIGAGMVWNARHSDRTGERYNHLAWPMLGAAVAFGVAAMFTHNGPLALAALVVGGFGLGGAQSVFWTIPTKFVGARNPGAIATINLCGNASSTVMPVAIGWIVASTGNITVPVYVLAGLMLFGALLIVPLSRLGNMREGKT
ncbi:MFS transporter [Sphingomonas sp. LT1P40]|uniref:MFS transporter n=1 Tax=Alteristakelama amylovorans TaxID=3096166 RepID=UPI002FCB0561